MKASGTKKRKLPRKSRIVSAERKQEEKPVFEEVSGMVESNLEEEDSKV